MARIYSEINSPSKPASQRLALQRGKNFLVIALHVYIAVEVVAGMRVPVSITHRMHYEKLPFLRTPNPQR